MKYIYPAIISKEGDGYLVDFPDFESCYTDGDTWEEAIENAEDALALMLWSMESDKEAIPPASNPASIAVPEGAVLVCVKADTLPVCKLNDKRTVRKNITLPGWLDTIAREHNINFSKLMQNALCKELNITYS